MIDVRPTAVMVVMKMLGCVEVDGGDSVGCVTVGYPCPMLKGLSV